MRYIRRREHFGLREHLGLEGDGDDGKLIHVDEAMVGNAEVGNDR